MEPGNVWADLVQKGVQLDIGPWMLGTVVVLIILEDVIGRLTGRVVHLREEAASWLVGVGYFLFSVLGARLLFFAAYIGVYEHYRLLDWQLTDPIAWLALLVIGDFVYYWMHRAEHTIRLLWATHENHHSARTLTFGTAVRMPWGEVLYHPLIGFWAPLLGFPPVMYPLVGAFNLVAGLLQHTELVGKLGPAEWILATPSHHRAHHGSDLQYLDCNYGARFIVWDRLFGTFRPEQSRPTYGLVNPEDSQNPFLIVTHGYRSLWADLRRASTLKDRWHYLWKPPGWSHDGPDLSVAARRLAQGMD